MSTRLHDWVELLEGAGQMKNILETKTTAWTYNAQWDIQELLKHFLKKFEKSIKLETDSALIAAKAAHEQAKLTAVARSYLLLAQVNDKRNPEKAPNLWDVLAPWDCKLVNPKRQGEVENEAYLNPSILCNLSPQEEFNLCFGYQLPWRENIETIKRLAGKKKIVELGAGLGLWGRLLTDAGVNIICTDDGSQYGYGKFRNIRPTFIEVKQLTFLDAVCQNRDCEVLLMIWPPPGGDQEELLTAVKYFRGSDIILIGERYGCTGSDELFDHLKAEWEDQPGKSEGYAKYAVHQPGNKGVYNLGLFHWSRPEQKSKK
jgi:hypothetical protein